MGFYKISSFEKNNIEIVKSYIMLYPYWKDNYFINNKAKIQTLLLLNLMFVENLLIEKDKDYIDIIINALMLKNKGLEYIAYSMYYSESGLRNKINIILKDINHRIQNLTFLEFFDD